MSGWKEWAIGEVVEAGDIQGFIQNQTVMVFDTDTARDTALTGVVIEGMMAYTKDSDSVKVYDGSAWIALAEAPDLSTLIPKSTVTTAGDLIVADGASSVTRLGAGADGSLLTVDTGSPAYLAPGTDDQVLTLVSGAPAWADAGGGGGWTLLSTFSGASGGLNVTGIDQSYKNLRVEATWTVNANNYIIFYFYDANGTQTFSDYTVYDPTSNNLSRWANENAVYATDFQNMLTTSSHSIVMDIFNYSSPLLGNTFSFAGGGDSTQTAGGGYNGWGVIGSPSQTIDRIYFIQVGGFSNVEYRIYGGN